MLIHTSSLQHSLFSEHACINQNRRLFSAIHPKRPWVIYSEWRRISRQSGNPHQYWNLRILHSIEHSLLFLKVLFVSVFSEKNQNNSVFGSLREKGGITIISCRFPMARLWKVCRPHDHFIFRLFFCRDLFFSACVSLKRTLLSEESPLE